MSLVEQIRQLVALDSSSGAGNLEVVQYLQNLAKEFGLMSSVQEIIHDGQEQANLLIGSKLDANFELILQSHLDTSDPGPYAKWTKSRSNPFEATVYGDEIFGLGVADAKVDILCKLHALKESKNARGVGFLGTFGQQSGMVGIRKLLKKSWIVPKRVLIGEPTSLNLIRSGAGLIEMETNIPFSPSEQNYRKQHDQSESRSSQSKMFYGKQSHSLNFEDEDNALVKLLDFLEQMPSGIALLDVDGGVNNYMVPGSSVLEFDVEATLKDTMSSKLNSLHSFLRDLESRFGSYRSSDAIPEIPKMNIAQMRTYNDFVKVQGSGRFSPNIPSDVYESWVKDLGAKCKSIGGDFRIKNFQRPFEVSKDTDFFVQCKKMLTELKISSLEDRTGALTEANVLAKSGIDVLVFGPGQGVGNSQEPNERILISESHMAKAFYSKTIERFRH